MPPFLYSPLFLPSPASAGLTANYGYQTSAATSQSSMTSFNPNENSKQVASTVQSDNQNRHSIQNNSNTMINCMPTLLGIPMPFLYPTTIVNSNNVQAASQSTNSMQSTPEQQQQFLAAAASLFLYQQQQMAAAHALYTANT
ncbi:hypothetical protein BLA29_008703, partial [Euroglyphus maynei]